MELNKVIIDYDDNENDIIHWTTLKGIYRYERMILFMKENSLALNWKNITNYMKYDKRILYNCFKYIIILEELLKSLIFQKIKLDVDIILKLEFSEAVKYVINIDEKIEFDDVDFNLLKKEKGAIISFRNAIVHNKMLLNREFRSNEEEKKGIKGKSLKEILEIYKKIIPKSYRNGFVSDICKCQDKLNIDSKFLFFNFNESEY